MLTNHLSALSPLALIIQDIPSSFPYPAVQPPLVVHGPISFIQPQLISFIILSFPTAALLYVFTSSPKTGLSFVGKLGLWFIINFALSVSLGLILMAVRG